jgi:glycosyltransferase involved in cell wall biosynthesis
MVSTIQNFDTDGRRERRILYVHNSADLYGASRSLCRLLLNLDRECFDALVVLPEDGPLKQRLEALNVRVLIHPSLSVITRPVFHSWRLLLFCLQFPLSVLWLWRLLRNERIDIVHTNTGVIVSPALAAKLSCVPHIWHIRDWFQEFQKVWKLYAAYINWTSAKVVAVSQAVANQFPRQEKIQVVHNGFSLEEFQIPDSSAGSQFRRRFGLRPDDFVVGCVGRIKLVRKGQDVLIKAMGILNARDRNAKCLIVGSPFPGNEQHLAELENLVRNLGLNDHVVFTGELADPRPAYDAMDVMVLPSAQPEPFGGVVMEAMAMGVPVIATRIGGSIDQVSDGETGFLVPPNDPEVLADKIQALMCDMELRSRMRVAAPARIESCFNIRNTVPQIERIYREAVDATR